MPARKKLLRTRSATGVAFALTVIVALFPIYVGGPLHISDPRGLLLLTLAVAFVTAGLFDEELIGGVDGPVWRGWVYFGIQIGLVCGICFVSEMYGMAALCLLPLVSNIVAAMGPKSAAFLVALVFGVYVGVAYTLYGTRGLTGNSLSILAGFAFVIVFTRIAVRENVARARAEHLSQELATANAQLRDYATRVEDLALTRERNRMAREIHDSLGHYLTTVAVQLEAAQALHATDPARALSAVAKAHTLVQDALLDVRRSVSALRAEGPDRPLVERVRELTSMESSTPVTLTILGDARPLGPDVAHCLFRAVQEGLTNVRKHAARHSVDVSIDFRHAAHVSVQVADRPPHPPANTASELPPSGLQKNSPSAGGFGLRGLRERVELLGGYCTAALQERGGFLLHVEVPA